MCDLKGKEKILAFDPLQSKRVAKKSKLQEKENYFKMFQNSTSLEFLMFQENFDNFQPFLVTFVFFLLSNLKWYLTSEVLERPSDVKIKKNIHIIL